MLDFARKTIPYDDIIFIHKDATNLAGFEDHSFDYATLLFLMHELPRSQQTRVLKEALRVAGMGIIIDSVAPLPKNVGGIGIRIVEGTFGRDHNQHFKNFLTTGGIRGIWEDMGLPIDIVHRSVFWRNCREMVMVTKSQ
jgi:ubiquinone/menaquinone biosynthesis C-methylase UbiE